MSTVVTHPTIQKLCIDAGNGGFKGALVRIVQPYQAPVYEADGVTVKIPEQAEVREVVTTYLPSKVGVGSMGMGMLDLGSAEKKRRGELKPIQIVSEDGAYLVGHGVERFAQLIERYDPNKYSDSPELRAMMRATLAQLVDGGSKEVAIAVMLPVSVMIASDAKETVRRIEDWMLGEHRFAYDGIETCIHVRAIKPLAQPVGAWASWGMDMHGGWGRSEEDLVEASVAVLDSGFNTLDLLLVKQARVEKRYTGGDDLGVRVAAQEIANAMDARYGVRWSLLEVDTLIREYVEKGKATRTFAGKKEDLTPIVKAALNTLASRTVDYVQNTWKNAKEFSYVILAGGGACVLDAAIRRHIPHAGIPIDPETGNTIDPVFANAVGGAKYAQRAGFFKGLTED